MPLQKHLFRSLLPVFPALLACLAALPAQALPQWTDAVCAAIEAERQAAEIPGLSCTIGLAGQLPFQRGFGFADLENEVPATPQTVYRLASISKPVTAVLAMQLVEKGLLDLDRDVHAVLPQWPEKPWPVTTRLLLAHLGGVRHYQGEDESTRHYATQTAALACFAADPLLHEPGTRYFYSTYGFNLVAAVVEQVTERSFAEVVRERIAEPSGALSLQDDSVRRLIRGRAQGYIRVDGVLQNSALMDGSYKLGGGGLCSSSDDLVRFAQALMDGKLVQPGTLETMWTQQRTRAGEPIDYALGFRLGTDRGHRLVSHGGAQSRVSTFLLLLPDQRLVIALLCNLEQVKLQALALRIAALVVPAAREAR